MSKDGCKDNTCYGHRYNLLLSMKSEDEDVSEAIIRLLKKKSRLVECAGLWRDIPDEEIEEIEEGMKEMRESLNLLLECEER